MNKRQSTKAAVKRETIISAATISSSASSRFSVLRGLSPSDLTRYIEQFEAGDFYWLGRTLEAMESRDHAWKISAAKARKDVSRRQWQVIPLDGYADDPDAADQATTLREFYSSIRVIDYRCKNVATGMRGLINNVMRAYNDWFAIQELVFTPDPISGKLTAEIMRCPIEWFELRNGYMHLRSQNDQPSASLEDGGWLISMSDGVGIACAVAYQFKRMALGDLAIYSGRCGQPGIQGKTNATYNSPEWQAMAAAVKNFGKEFSAVTGMTDVLDKIDLSISGELPQPIIVEMMNRAIASLQRGADLSTMSAGVGSGEGASLQGDEAELLTADNCAMVTETLRAQLDPYVIAWHYGTDAEIKAGVKIIPPESDTTEQDLATDTALLAMGIKLSRNATLERYNRTEADPSDPDDSPLAPIPPPSSTSPAIYGGPTSFANEAQTSTGSPTPQGSNTTATQGGSPGIPDPDPVAAILNAAAAKILDGSIPFAEARTAALAELAKLPAAAANLPDTFETALTEAMFTAASANLPETE